MRARMINNISELTIYAKLKRYFPAQYVGIEYQKTILLG